VDGQRVAEPERTRRKQIRLGERAHFKNERSFAFKYGVSVAVAVDLGRFDGEPICARDDLVLDVRNPQRHARSFVECVRQRVNVEVAERVRLAEYIGEYIGDCDRRRDIYPVALFCCIALGSSDARKEPQLGVEWLGERLAFALAKRYGKLEQITARLVEPEREPLAESLAGAVCNARAKRIAKRARDFHVRAADALKRGRKHAVGLGFAIFFCKRTRELLGHVLIIHERDSGSLCD